MLPERVRIVEVGPRDGLQNEQGRVRVEDKVALVDALVAAGLQHVEVGSFVSPRWVPQMADSAAVFSAIQRSPGVTYAALTPNLQGFEAAIQAGASEVAVFAAASESFSQRNINCSIAQSLQRFEPVLAAAALRGIKVRGYVSCVLGCPYEGEIAAVQVRDVASAMLQMGCYEISLGDTLGVGTPGAARKLIEVVAQRVPRAHLAGHFHDTYGQAVANIYACLLEGLQVFDSSVAGLGGCPYAPGASGNVATEDVLYLLHGLGIATGVDLAQVVQAGQSIMLALGRQSASRVARAHAGAAVPR
ncbi:MULTISPECIES: hydroxymethylglutaryl-CoA lyase [unclassified Pseudomonas]|uniref:hydroxymethylglutaryl-CoA lyase n=1 Tax=unclassified Pseudomonas TaxID=196821 RepID=UPI001780145F|nr:MULTISPECIES: hydroxymethylglutaryl-CoA lyase [unclassified Pseudomonas]MBD8621938.1 hydroxymethylglutaryl-CoA lyase [Pseudomonas sp. CFBP 13727]MBD8732482.1 hydroxymethylglutaryl-CoA lyase [Pseudomonas sp. CFBP 13710]